MVLVVLACIHTQGLADNTQYKDFGALAGKGKTLWLENCEGCHGYGIAGAPIPFKPAQWEHRVAKPVNVLYTHAIEGFFGPGDTHMPARGGNAELSDEEVRRAVDYMLALVRYYLSTNQEMQK